MHTKITKQRLIWMINSAIIIACLFAFIWLVVWILHVGSSKHIESIASQFVPDDEWIYKNEQITPPASFCIGMECPSMYRAWTVQRPMTYEDMENIIKKSNWNLVKDTDCKLQNEGNTNSCTARGTADKYDTSVTITGGNRPSDIFTVSIYIRETDA